MWISRLTVKNCRVLQQLELQLDAQANLIYGANASGKSSLLEALALLSRGRSFRTPRLQEVLHYGEQELAVGAQIEGGVAGHSYPVGLSKTTKQTRIRINYADVSQQAELSLHVPLTLIHPGSVELVTAGPALRRAFLDWIAFYRFAEFNTLWRQYQRVLKQRNACLRQPTQRFALPQWTQQFIQLQPLLYQFRAQALQALQNVTNVAADVMQALGQPELMLTTGFPADIDIHDAEALQRFLLSKQEQELKQGFSLYGVHRADLQINLGGVAALKVASRGQLKLLAVGLLLAQSYAISDETAKRGIIAIDDLASELDEQNQQALYNTLHTTQQQLIITGTRLEPFQNWMNDAHVFHVKQGQFNRV